MAPNDVDLSGVIVELKITTGQKNPYSIHFPKTDRDGRARLSGADLMGQFSDHHQMALMDYYGTITDASPIVQVLMFDPTWLKANLASACSYPLLRSEMGKWASREHYVQYMISCRNDHFVAEPVSVNIEETPDLMLNVRSR